MVTKVVQRRSNWPKGYRPPPVFPVVIDYSTGKIHDFTRTWPLTACLDGGRVEDELEIPVSGLKTMKGSLVLMKHLLGQSELTGDQPKLWMQNLESEGRSFTHSYHVFKEELCKKPNQRLDINLITAISEMVKSKTPHMFSMEDFDLSDRVTKIRDVDIEVASNHRWSGYVSMITSKRGQYLGLVEILNIKEDVKMNVHCLTTVDLKRIASGRVYPLFKRSM